MSAPKTSQRWTLREKPYGEAVLSGPNSTFSLETVDIPALKDGQVLLKTVYLSNDPAQRSWISPLVTPERLYVPPVQVGQSMGAMGICRVVESRSPDLQVGALVTARPGWNEYAVEDAQNLKPLALQPGLSETHFLGALGLPGFTAYHALFQVVKATSKDAIVISGAAGAVGNVAVQIAKKMIGCRKVIGIAGTDDKCRWVEKLGADVCVNYKSPSFKEELKKATEGFVEIYFDNVGGEILDFMLTRLARYGRVAACGTISNYNKDSDAYALKNFYEVVSMRLQILGFINIDAIAQLGEYQAYIVDQWKKGNMIIGDENEMVVDTDFADIPRTWMMLYSGGNTGKLVTKLKE